MTPSPVAGEAATDPVGGPDAGLPGPLAGRVVIVTGAARGLGRAYTLELCRQGAAVVANDLAVASVFAANATGFPRSRERQTPRNRADPWPAFSSVSTSAAHSPTAS